MKILISISDGFNKWLLNLISILFGVVALLTLYQVFARYVLESSLTWSESLVRYSIIWIVLLGTAIALRKGMLISVDTLQYFLPQKLKKGLQIIILLINIVFFIFLINYGFGIMQSLSTQTSGSLDVSVSWFYAALPVGGIVALFNAIVSLIVIIFNGEEGTHGSNTIH